MLIKNYTITKSKTTGVYLGTVKLLQKFHAGDGILNDVVVVHGANKDSAAALITSLGLDTEHTRSMSKEDFMRYISSLWKPLTQVNGKYQVTDLTVSSEGDIRSSHKINEMSNAPSLILMDETTNFTLFDLDDIDAFATRYGISTLAAGDTDLSGIEGEYGVNATNKDGDTIFKSWVEKSTGELKGLTSKLQLYSCNFIRTPKLGVSMRTANQLKSKNLIDTQVWIKNPSLPLNLRYCLNENGLFGDAVVRLDTNSTDDSDIESYLKEYLDAIFATTEGKVGYIYNESSEPNALKELLESPEYKDKVDFYPGTSALGKEGQYFIIDIDNRIAYEDNTDEDVANKFLHDLYTGITRSEQGSLIILHDSDSPTETGELYCPSIANLDIHDNLDSVKEQSTLLEQLNPKIVRNYASERKGTLIEDSADGKDIVYKKRAAVKPGTTSEENNNPPAEDNNPPRGGTVDPNIPPAPAVTLGSENNTGTTEGANNSSEDEEPTINWEEKITDFKDRIGDIGTKIKSVTTDEVFTIQEIKASDAGDKLSIVLSGDTVSNKVTLETTIGHTGDSGVLYTIVIPEERVDYSTFDTTEMPENFLLNIESLPGDDVEHVFNFDKFKPSQSWWEKYLKIPYNDKALVVLIFYNNGLYGLMVDIDPTNDDIDYLEVPTDFTVELLTSGLFTYTPKNKTEENPEVPDIPEMDGLTEGEALDMVVEFTSGTQAPIKPRVAINTEAVSMEILFDTSLANETGVSLEVDAEGKPVQTGNEETNAARIDSINGFINLDKLNKHEIRTLDEYLNILAKLKSIVLTETDPGKLNKKLAKVISKEFGITDIKHIFGFRSLPNTGTNKGDYSIFNRDFSQERIQGIFGEGEHNGEILSKAIVCTIGSKELGDIIELPICAINNPVSVLQMTDLDGSYVFDEIVTLYDFNSTKPLNQKCDEFILRLKSKGLYNKYEKLAKLFELYKITSSIYIPFNFKDANDISWTFAKDMKSLGPRMVAKSKAQLRSSDGVYELEGFSNNPGFHTLSRLASTNRSLKMTPLLYAKRNTITGSDGNAIEIEGDDELLKTGHAFILYTYADDVDDIYSRFIAEMEDSALPEELRKLTRKVNIAYVLPPHESIEKYIDILHKILTTRASSRPALDNLGNSFTAYNIVRELWNSPEFLEKVKLNDKDNFIAKVAEVLQLCQQAQDNAEGIMKQDALFALLKGIINLDPPVRGLKSGVSVRQLLQHVLSEIVYPTSKVTGTRKVLSNLDLINLVLANTLYNQVYYHLDKADQERGHGQFYELNLEFDENGTPLWAIKNVNGDLLEYTIHGNIVSPIAIADPTLILDLVLGNVLEQSKTTRKGTPYKMYVYLDDKTWMGQRYIHHLVTGKKQETTTIETKTPKLNYAIELSKKLHNISPIFDEIEDIEDSKVNDFIKGKLIQLNTLNLAQCGFMVGDKYIIFDRSNLDLDGEMLFYDSKEDYDLGKESNIQRTLDNTGKAKFFTTIGDKEFDVIYDSNSGTIEFYSKGLTHPVWAVNETNITPILNDLHNAADEFEDFGFDDFSALSTVQNLEQFYGTASGLAETSDLDVTKRLLLKFNVLPEATINAVIEYLQLVKDDLDRLKNNCSIKPITIKLV